MKDGPFHLVEVDILVVGSGPAGGALAAFLGQNGNYTLNFVPIYC
jgi:flavin-dependent dehydrogenase